MVWRAKNVSRFYILQAGPAQPVCELMANIEIQIEKIRFKKSGSIYKAELDDRGVFEENEKYIISGKKIRNAKNEIKDWEGLSVEFNCNRYTVYFLICNYKGQYLNSFIEISGKTIAMLTLEDEFDSLMMLIGTVAKNIKSQGGFGSFDVYFEPIPPEKIIPHIFHNSEGVPSLLGVIPYNDDNETKFRKMALIDYKIHISTLGFYFLEHKDFR